MASFLKTLGKNLREGFEGWNKKVLNPLDGGEVGPLTFLTGDGGPMLTGIAGAVGGYAIPMFLGGGPAILGTMLVSGIVNAIVNQDSDNNRFEKFLEGFSLGPAVAGFYTAATAFHGLCVAGDGTLKSLFLVAKTAYQKITNADAPSGEPAPSFNEYDVFLHDRAARATMDVSRLSPVIEPVAEPLSARKELSRGFKQEAVPEALAEMIEHGQRSTRPIRRLFKPR